MGYRKPSQGWKRDPGNKVVFQWVTRAAEGWAVGRGCLDEKKANGCRVSCMLGSGAPRRTCNSISELFSRLNAAL